MATATNCCLALCRNKLIIFNSFRLLRGSAAVIRDNSKRTGSSDIKLENGDSSTPSTDFKKVAAPEPARHIHIPDRRPPTGFHAVETWQSPVGADQKNTLNKREIYEERFLVAETINSELDECGQEANKILDVVDNRRSNMDNMNTYNALGYLHVALKSSQAEGQNEVSPLSKSLLKDARFLQLCNLLYKKSRSYPPNACIGNVARLVELGVPFRTPIVYVFLNLLKESINNLTTADAITLAQCLAPFSSLRLPTALNAGLQILVQKQADNDFDSFVSKLGEVNPYHGELNMIVLLRRFGEKLTPITRNRVFYHIANRYIEPGLINGPNLLKLMSLLNKDWVSQDYVDKCFSKLETKQDLNVFNAINVAELCIRFRRNNEQILLKNMVQMVQDKFQVWQSGDSFINASKMFVLLLVQLKFAAPSLLLSTLSHLNHPMKCNEIGLSEFLEAVAVHLHEDSETIARIVNSEEVRECVSGSNPEENWKILDPKVKLILCYFKTVYGIDVPYLPTDFPPSFEKVQEMLAGVTADALADVSEKLEIWPQLMATSRLCGLKVGDNDLVLRMYIPAVRHNDQHSAKLYIVPIGSSDFYQNRFDVVWTCRLRFVILQRFLAGSNAISVVPVSLVRFRSLNSDRERYAYVKDCLENKGDRDLLKMLRL